MNALTLKHGVAVIAAGLALGLPAAAAAKRPAPTPTPAPNNADEWTLINLKPGDVASVSGGAGISVAVLDGLTDCRHSEFNGTPRRCEYNLIEGGRYRFYGSHGTHVAGIVAGARHGVAPGASIINYAVFDDRFYVATGDKLINAWRGAAAKGATVSNMSFGCTGLALCFTAAEVAAMAGADMGSMLFVKAAGNDSVDLENEAVAVSGDVARAAMARLMLVGSVDVPATAGAAPVMSSFSNRPGENCLLPSGAGACSGDLKWKQYFIVAPGRNIYSALPGESYGFMSGTSMASPVVAGAAALMQKKWPTLKPEQIAGILFSTATDLGATGVDAVYGWGLLNVGNAFSAQGPVTLQRTDGTATAVSGTAIVSSPTLSRLATALGAVTVYDKFDRDFALGETGALQVRPGLHGLRQGLGKRLLGRGGQDEWASSLFASERSVGGFLAYGSPLQVAADPVASDRSARMGIDLPFKGGVAQLRMTGASATRTDLANDPSLKPLSFFASSALMDSSLLGHGLVKLSDTAALSVYAAKSTDPIAPELEDPGLTPHIGAHRQARLLSLGTSEQEQRKSTVGIGYWARPDSRTVLGLNASAIAQDGGWYDLALVVPGGKTETRMVNVGALASRRIGAWEASASAEVSHLRTSTDGLFSFTPATLVSGEVSVRRGGLLFHGSTADSLVLAVALPPRAVAGSLDLEHMTRTADGLGRQAVALRTPLSRMGADSPKLEAAYRVSGKNGWSLGVAGGLNLNGETTGGEFLAQLRLGL